MPVYYDISDIFDYLRDHATVTGIQRVSLNMLARLVDRHGAQAIRVVAWQPGEQRFLAYDAAFFAGDHAFDRDRFLRRFKVARPAARIVRDWMARRASARDGALQTPIQRDSGRPVDWRQGDVLFVPGATWGLSGYRDALRDVSRRHGVAVHQFIHDLIPLVASEHVVEGLPRTFEGWLSDLAGYAQGFVANSEATRADLAAWLELHQRAVPLRVVPLAHQFGLEERGAAGSDPSRLSARVRDIGQRPYVLCVGTRESRKNLWSLATAWRLIAAKLGADTPRLVFAGSRGWLNDDFDNLMASTGALYGYVSILERPSDAELAHLYRHCLFSAFVSFKEGWGLPIGEGLWFGRPVLCSNVSAMPEVGGDLADYADPQSVNSIVAAATRLIADSAYREARAAAIAAAKLRTWQDVADDLWIALNTPRSG